MTAFLQDEAAVFFIMMGIVLWSLLCVMAALRNNGKALEKQLLMLACQFFLVVAALFQCAVAETVIAQVMGFVIFGLAIASIFFRREIFQGSRYCIALGAVLAAVSMLLF